MTMGTLQPGVHTMILQGYYTIIFDLKDCFFSIPLHPDDKKHLMFSAPTLSNQEPMILYQ